MIRMRFNDGTTYYDRVSKATARNMFETGKPVYAIAHKMQPGIPFNLGMTLQRSGDRMEFETTVQEFCYYNANCRETGTYAAFYTMTDVFKAVG